MTNEDAIKVLKGCTIFANGKASHEALDVAIEALEKQAINEKASDKYRWHYLRKDRKDLPNKLGFYIACVENPINHTRNTREITLYNIVGNHYVWQRNNKFVNEANVIAWKEIEPFEG